MRRSVAPLVLSLLSLALAGCADDAPQVEDDLEVADPTAGTDGPGNTTQAPGWDRPVPTVLNLTGAQRLVEEPAGEGKVTLNFGPAGIVNREEPTVLEGPVWPHDVHIRSVSIAGHVDTDTPVVGTQVENEIIIWLGVDGNLFTAVFADAPDTLLPGDAAPFTAEVPLARGLTVPAGSRLTLALGTLYTDDGSLRSTHLLTGPEKGTALTFEAEWVDLPALEEPMELLAETGELAGSTCFGVATGDERVSFTFDVPEGTAALEAHLVWSGGTTAGNDDLDVQIMDAAGDRVGGTSGPRGTESLHLWAPEVQSALPGTWTAVVTTCALQQATFELTVLASAPE